MGWMGYAGHMGEMRNTQKNIQKLEGKMIAVFQDVMVLVS
jgi:hypothetical protein